MADPVPGLSAVEFPYRIVDSENQGWLTRSDGVYEGYDPTQTRDHQRLEPRHLSEVEAQFGPWRPVVPPTAGECEELRAVLELAGRKAVGSIASALEHVYNEARNRFGPWDGDPSGTAAYAQRTLIAGRPGSWEAGALMEVVYFGSELNLYDRKGAASVEEIRSKGPSPRRVQLEVRDRIVAVLEAWTASSDRYTEVPENLAGLVGRFADEHHGADGWRAIADQWLQPGSLDQENFAGTYRLLYSTSAHFSLPAG